MAINLNTTETRFCICGCGRAISGINSKGKLRLRFVGHQNTTHGHLRNYKSSPEYVAWKSMKQRCLNKNHKSYPQYGGRGITICDRWLNSFENFLADVGPRPDGMQIDRINNDGNYEPGNVHWATPKQNSNNRRIRIEGPRHISEETRRLWSENARRQNEQRQRNANGQFV